MPQNIVGEFESFVGSGSSKPAGIAAEFESFVQKSSQPTGASKAPAIQGFDEKHPYAAKALDLADEWLVKPFDKAARWGAETAAGIVPEDMTAQQFEMLSAVNPLVGAARGVGALAAGAFPGSERERAASKTLVTGVAKDTLSIAGGFLADPRNWPFLASGAKSVMPALRAVVDLGFAAMQQSNAINDLREGNYQSAAMNQAFALLGMASAPKNIKDALARRIMTERFPEEVSFGPKFQVLNDALMAEKGARARDINRQVGELVGQGRGERLPDGSVVVRPVAGLGGTELPPIPESPSAGAPVRPAGPLIRPEEVQTKLSALPEDQYSDLLDYIYPKAEEIRAAAPEIADALDRGEIGKVTNWLLDQGDETVAAALGARQPELTVIPEGPPSALRPEKVEEAALLTLGADRYAELKAAGATVDEIEQAITQARMTTLIANQEAAKAGTSETPLFLRQRDERLAEERRKLAGESPTGVERRGARAAEAPKTVRTYDEVQVDIDAVRDRLKAEGREWLKLYDPAEPGSKWIIPGRGWEPMPPELVRLYAERDAIGAFEMQQGSAYLTERMHAAGIPAVDTAEVLKEFGLISDTMDAIAQQNAVEGNKRILALTLDQAERVADDLSIRIAIKESPTRGIEIDELRDVPQNIRQRARNAVAAIRQALTDSEPVGEIAAPRRPSDPFQQPTGRETNIYTPNGQQYRAVYKLSEANTLTPSHQAMTFAENPNYPSGVQERRYDTDKVAQMETIKVAQNMIPEKVINNDPTGANGPPIATPDGLILGGNGRTMAIQRAYYENNGQTYKEYLKAHAAEYGLDPATVDAMENPVLHLELQDLPGDAEGLRRVGQELNVPVGKGLPEFQRAVSAGKNLSPLQVDEIATIIELLPDEKTVRAAMREEPAVFRRIMLDSGAIPENQLAEFFDTETGAITDKGKLFIENALLGNVIDDVNLLESMPAGVRNKIERALPGLIELSRRNDQWNIIPEVQEAVQEIVRANALGLPLHQAFEQRRFGFEAEMRPKVLFIGKTLLGKAAEASRKFKAFATEARMDSPNNPSMFSPDFDATFRQVFEVPEGQTLYFMGLDPARVKSSLTKLFGQEKHPDPDVQAVLDRVSKDGPAPVRNTWNEFYRATVDALDPLRRAVEALETLGKRKMPTEQNAYELARLNAGWMGKANAFLNNGTFDPVTLQKTGKGFKEILAPFHGKLDDVRAYLVAKRAAEKSGQGVATGIPTAEAIQTVRKLETPEMLQLASDLKDYQNSLLDFLGANFFKPEELARMRAMNEDYVPFYRVVEGEAPVSSVYSKGKGRSFVDLWNPVRQMKGSERLVVDPLESIIKNTYTFINLAERNAVAKSFVQQARSTPGGEVLAEKLKPPMRAIEFPLKEIKNSLEQAGALVDDLDLDTLAKVYRAEKSLPRQPGVISVMEGGIRRYYRVHPEVYKALTALDREPMTVLTRILSAPARALRLGATGISPEFLIRNPVRDAQTAFLQSKTRFIPGIDTIRGTFHALRRDALFWEWTKAGGASAAMVSLDRNTLRQHIRDMEAHPLKWAAMHPIEALRYLGETSEAATRLGEFQRSREMGASPRAAALESREVTLDFARMGARTQAVNSIVAFWNAAVQSTDKFARMHRDMPRTAMLRGAAAVTLPSLLLYYVNRDNPDYQELPQWQKDFFWLIPTQGTPLEEHTKFMPIPKPFLWGMVYGTVPERALEYIDTKDPRAFDELGNSLYQTSAPGIIPSAAGPIAEVWGNKSLFTGRPIETRQMEELPATERYETWTSEFAKSMSKGLKQAGVELSPVKIEQLLFGYTAGAGRAAVKLVDPLFAAPKKEGGGVEPAQHMADIPLLRAFAVRFPTSQAVSVQEMYERLSELREKKRGIDYTNKYRREGGQVERLAAKENSQLTRLESAATGISDLHRQIRRIQSNKFFDAEKKRAEIDKRFMQMIKKSQDALRAVGPRVELPEVPEQPTGTYDPSIF